MEGKDSTQEERVRAAVQSILQSDADIQRLQKEREQAVGELRRLGHTPPKTPKTPAWKTPLSSHGSYSPGQSTPIHTNQQKNEQTPSQYRISEIEEFANADSVVLINSMNSLSRAREEGLELETIAETDYMEFCKACEDAEQQWVKLLDNAAGECLTSMAG